jgi:uncharacterized protein YndB with AHSA1/START domain
METTVTTAAPSRTDRIEERVTLPQPRARVWRALTDPAELGAWFGMNLTGATLAPGAHVRGHFTIPGHEHAVFDATIEAVEPERRFAWRWHPSAGDATLDLADEPRTLVTFTLEDTPDGGTLLRVVETGFDALSPARHAVALPGNTRGWASQLLRRLPSYLASA